MSSAFRLLSRSADLQAFQHLAFAAGKDAFHAAQPYTVDDAAPLARWAWDDALAHDGWQDDDPTADTYVEDLAAARQVGTPIANATAAYRTMLGQGILTTCGHVALADTVPTTWACWHRCPHPSRCLSGDSARPICHHERWYCQVKLLPTEGGATCAILVAMKTSTTASPYKRHRYPVEIIGYAVWLYFRFSLSYRDVEELLAERGVVVTYETIRQWCLKFGQQYANELRRRRPKPGDKWHLDEVFIRINGRTYYLWRAVDQYGAVLDILVQSRRNKAAAKNFFRKLLKGYAYVPRVLVTDKLARYGAAQREVLPSVEHRRHKRLNNRAENSHQPTRQRERTMRCFKSAGQAQRFLSAFGPIREHVHPGRHRLKAAVYRQERMHRF